MAGSTVDRRQIRQNTATLCQSFCSSYTSGPCHKVLLHIVDTFEHFSQSILVDADGMFPPSLDLVDDLSFLCLLTLIFRLETVYNHYNDVYD